MNELKRLMRKKLLFKNTMCDGEKIIIPEEAIHMFGVDMQGDLIIMIDEKTHQNFKRVKMIYI